MAQVSAACIFNRLNCSIDERLSRLVVTLNVDRAGARRSNQTSVTFEAEAEGNGRILLSEGGDQQAFSALPTSSIVFSSCA
ncbi:hypothetical protein HGG76_06950 [Ochrobactrum tritici]|uniref:Uncharacterized protein n=1 Tax=Brucella tritici TaxID=94626 RepID=A0A7X6JCJ7_9HYPH|nr:hypothetical protein [Brucella tritici]